MKDKPVREKKNLDKGLKRSVGKPACCVSKGGSSSNTASLPDLKNSNVKISRLACGIPIGGEIDYLDEGTLKIALTSRQEYE